MDISTTTPRVWTNKKKGTTRMASLDADMRGGQRGDGDYDGGEPDTVGDRQLQAQADRDAEKDNQEKPRDWKKGHIECFHSDEESSGSSGSGESS